MRKLILAAAAAFSLAACSGNSGVFPTGRAPVTTAPMSFRVVIPVGQRQSNARRQAYVSEATQSVAFTLTQWNGAPQSPVPTIVALTGGNCSGSPLVCTVTTQEPVGADVFTVATYASRPSAPMESLRVPGAWHYASLR